MSDAEKQGERFYVITAGATSVDLSRSFGTLHEATFAAQHGQLASDAKLIVLGIRFCATIITAAAPAAIGGGRGGRRSVRVVHDRLPAGGTVYEIEQRPARIPIAALEGDVELCDEIFDVEPRRLPK